MNLNDDPGSWDPVERHIRYVVRFGKSHFWYLQMCSCMEHAVHLAAGHFIRAVAPTSTSKLIKKMKTAVKNASVAGEVDLDLLDAELSRNNRDEGDEEGDEDEEEGEEELSDTIGKALALVKQACVQFHSIK